MKKVLIVDDDPSILLSLEFLVKKAGYQTFIARNGAEALTLYDRERPHVVVLDIMMPEMDGYEVCERIRQAAHIPRPFIVFLTAKSREADMAKGITAGADMYVTKPFSTRSLMEKINTAMEQPLEPDAVRPRVEDEHARSIADPTGFWAEQMRMLRWEKEPTTILERPSPDRTFWFPDGITNISARCIDDHIAAGRGDRTAIIHDSPVTDSVRKYSYNELLTHVSRLAGAMEAAGLRAGDTAVIYMPMVPEAMFAMLACARIGVTHSVVFGGFAPRELAIRIDDAKPRIIFTASCGIEADKVIPYKPLIDGALAEARHAPDRVVLLQRPQCPVALGQGESDWHSFVASAKGPAAAVPLPSTHPLYILYTSGTTGKPKGIVRDTGGYATALHYSMRDVYDTKPEDVFWAASDIGWAVGHSYTVYGPLLLGCTTVLFEGKPVRTPDAGTFWRVVQQHGVNTLFTAPTAIRAIRKEDPEGALIQKYNRTTLRALFLAGERCDPATWEWASSKLRIPVIDHWWQTESGWPMVATMRGLTAPPPRPGSAGQPVPGYDVRILSEEGRELIPGQEGYVAVKLPLPPGCLPTLWNDHERFQRSYLATYPGFYMTGDGGYYSPDGYLHIMGRIDDVINVSGHRLSTGGMEEIIATHPAVAESAVIGITCDLRGQRPIGLVVLKDRATISEAKLEQELVQLIRDKVGAVAVFKDAVLVKRLPKTRSGKVLRKTMRDIADGAHYAIPATIEDPNALNEIHDALQARAIGKAFEKLG
ncbi:MAG TPA: AMP-binding protein [Flavobacteriales bacterium]